jgi:ADP-heptose:LPS heptosyltransferase
LVSVLPEAKAYAENLIREATFSNTGPLIAVQAGASQGKRQWAPAKFAEMIKILVEEYSARIVMTGSSHSSSVPAAMSAVGGCVTAADMRT